MSSCAPVTASWPPAAVGPVLRSARALFVSSGAWAAASAGHLIAGGRVPSAWTVLGLIALSAWPLTLALRRRAGAMKLVMLLGATQAGMHVALVLGASGAHQGASPVDPHSMPDPHAMHAMTGIAGMTDIEGMTGMTGMPSPTGMTGAGGIAGADSAHAMSLLPGPGMLAAHVLAAVLLGLLLADGERSLFSLLGLLSRTALPRARGYLHVLTALAMGPADATTLATLRRTRHRQEPASGRRQLLLIRAMPRRGPPTALQGA